MKVVKYIFIVTGENIYTSKDLPNILVQMVGRFVTERQGYLYYRFKCYLIIFYTIIILLPPASMSNQYILR